MHKTPITPINLHHHIFSLPTFFFSFTIVYFLYLLRLLIISHSFIKIQSLRFFAYDFTQSYTSFPKYITYTLKEELRLLWLLWGISIVLELKSWMSQLERFIFIPLFHFFIRKDTFSFGGAFFSSLRYTCFCGSNLPFISFVLTSYSSFKLSFSNITQSHNFSSIYITDT